MDSDLLAFSKTIAHEKMSNLDRAVAILWWHGHFSSASSKSAAELASAMEVAGYAKQNVSRLNGQLKRDQRTAHAGSGKFRIRVNRIPDLDVQFRDYSNRRAIIPTDSVVPTELVAGTRGYLEKVVLQINGSFDCGFFDCCAVMCRRLLETLLIEVYEHQGRSDELKGFDGNYMMFSGMLSHVESDTSLGLSRNGLKALRDFKRLGDLSAHNRRFNARKSDIDRIRDGIRVATEELLHMAGLMA